MKFYSAWYCPFAQRAWMALLYKNIDFEYVEVDPYEKAPDWMLISRGVGQVPVVIDGVDTDREITVPDSIRILEYIDMQFPNAVSLYPQTNQGMANTKFLVDFQGREIIPYMYRFLKAEPNSDTARDARRHLEHGLEKFAADMVDEGPFFAGNVAGAVDIAFAPFALRIEYLLSFYRDYTLPLSGHNWERYHEWWQALRTFPPLVKTSTDQPQYMERLLEFYRPYSEGGGQTDVTAIK